MHDFNNNSKLNSSYKFKYIYLVLGIFFTVAISLTYILPVSLPNVFFESTWTVNIDPNTGQQTINHIPNSTAMIVINVLRDIFISGLVGVILYAFYEHRFEKEEKQALIDGVDSILSNSIEFHVTKAILNSAEINEQVLSSEFVDKILNNCLIKKTGDVTKSNAIMKSILKDVINAKNTVRDLDVSMTLHNFSDSSNRYSKYATYRMTYVIRYKVILTENKFVFILTNNKDFQNNNLGAFIYCQFVDSSFSGKEVYFNVNEITIDGVSLSQLGSRKTETYYIKEEYWNDVCSDKKGQEVQVCYSVDFLIRKKSNHYSYFTPFMTDGINLKFDASSTDIKRIKLLPYFNSGEKPTILPPVGTVDNPKIIEIHLNDWVLPSSGAAFIWQFENK